MERGPSERVEEELGRDRAKRRMGEWATRVVWLIDGRNVQNATIPTGRGRVEHFQATNCLATFIQSLPDKRFAH
jgi:hypothetical protein